MHTRFRITRGSAIAIAALVAIVASVAVVGVSAIAGGKSVKSEHWGVVPRNTIGSPVADYRDGPYGSFGHSGPTAEPPFGKGSLGIEVANPSGATEKVDFGNEVDFFGDPVLGITDIGFHVFNTQENGASNMPNIRLEIDPNTPSDTNDYSTMVFVPDPTPPGSLDEWSGYIDATTTGQWYFTGAADVPPCNQTTTCTFAAAKAALAVSGAPDPIIYTVAVGKGRDKAWVGAIDGFRINDKVYDFESEPKGTHQKSAK